MANHIQINLKLTFSKTGEGLMQQRLLAITVQEIKS